MCEISVNQTWSIGEVTKIETCSSFTIHIYELLDIRRPLKYLVAIQIHEFLFSMKQFMQKTFQRRMKKSLKAEKHFLWKTPPFNKKVAQFFSPKESFCAERRIFVADIFYEAAT